MRVLTAMLALTFLLTACGGGGGDSAEFCDLMEEFVNLADEAIAGAEEGDVSSLEELTQRVEEIITEAEEAAPDEIADIIDSSDPADQEEITNYVRDECGVDLPDF